VGPVGERAALCRRALRRRAGCGRPSV